MRRIRSATKSMRGIELLLVACCVLLPAGTFGVQVDTGKLGLRCAPKSVLRDCGVGLACIDSSCSFCAADDECEARFECASEDVSFPTGSETRQVCLRPPFFQSWDALTWLAVVLVSVGATMAAGGGLGGGGIFVPMYIIFLHLSPQEAVPLSQATIFGGSLVNMWFNARKRSPLDPSQPLIDAPTVAVLEPMLLAGTVVGVLLNVVFPPWLITFCLAVTLTYAAVRSTKKGIRAWKLESDAQGEKNAILEPPGAVELESVGSGGGGPPKRQQQSAESAAAEPEQSAPRVVAVTKRDQLLIWSVVAVIWAVVLVFSFSRGGRAGAPSAMGVAPCSGAYWGVTAAQFVVLFALTVLVAVWLAARNEGLRSRGWEPKPGEIEWTRKNLRLYPFLACFAGVAGGLLGIGGGMVLGPLLLELGLHPRVTSATSATAVFLTASSASVQFIALDMLLVDYAWFFAIVGVVATWVGQVGVDYAVRRYGRLSLIIFSIAGVIGLATLMMVAIGIVDIVEGLKDGKYMGFTPLC